MEERSDTYLERLIEKGIEKEKVQTWADLGAGSGRFTTALSNLLPKGSSIMAIDKKPSNISIPNVKTRTGDFLDLDFENTDGILMANALHYVKDQKDFIDRLSKKTKRLILVEYDTDRKNQWVPYPISFNKLKSLFPNAERIGHAPSQYHAEGMYSALLILI